MKILHAYNRHRGGGGADNACDATIRLSVEQGLDVEVFARSSLDLGEGLRGKVKAFVSGVYAADAVSDFRDHLRRSRPDVVHVHELYPLISPWILPVCSAAGIPVVMTCYDFRLTCPIATHFRRGRICHQCAGGREHRSVINNCRGNPAESLAYGLRGMVARRFRLFYDHVSCFIVLSEFSAEWLTDHAGIKPDRILLNPCVIPLPSEPVADPGAGAYVGYAGRFVPEKGVEILVEAARRAALPLKLAGDAPSHPAVRPEDGTELVMTRSATELASFYRGARMIVVPSIWYETFGIVPAEAMSHGVPVVVSKLGALQQIAIDGESGVHFAPGDIADLARVLTALWNDPPRCRRLGAAARERIAERCSAGAHMQRLLGAYERARASPPPAALRAASRG